MTGNAGVQGDSLDRPGRVDRAGRGRAGSNFARPPLTKGLWLGKEESSIWRGTEDEGVELELGRRIVSLDLEGRKATDDAGDTYAYERVLLATGGVPGN